MRWTMCRCLAIALGLGAFAVSAESTPAGNPSKSDGLSGSYEIVSGEKDGAPAPDERIKGTMVCFTMDRIVVTDPKNIEVYGASYVLDRSSTPWKVVMTSKLAPNEGEVAKGLIEMKGDVVRLIYAIHGGEEPREFKTKEKQLLFEMKRRGS